MGKKKLMKALDGKGTHSLSKLACAIFEVYCYYKKCFEYCQKVSGKKSGNIIATFGNV